MIAEYIARGLKNSDFDIGMEPEALRPAGMECEHAPGFGQTNLDIYVDGATISFSPEPPGWQIVFDSPHSEAWVEHVARAILKNMENFSGQPGELLRTA